MEGFGESLPLWKYTLTSDGNEYIHRPMKIKMTAKCSDCFSATLHDDKGKMIGDVYDGYVPDFIPGEYGDYVMLDIDVETGKILNWKVPTEAQLAETFTPDKD